MRLLKTFAVIILVGAVFFFVVNFLLTSSPANVPPPTVIPHSVNTTNGVIQVPSTAYIEAFDPATNSNIPAINVRSEARSAQPPACTLSDGATVSVSNSTRADGSAWLYVTSGGCRGWVLSEFVTPDR
jgi:hypothetical protein